MPLGTRGAVLLVALMGALSLEASADKVTVMDPVFVEASPVGNRGASGRSWQYLSIPGFEILSRCPDGFNAAFVRALQKGNAARLALLPEAFWGQLATPIKIVLYNRPPEPQGGVWRAPIDLSWSAEDSAIIGLGSMQESHPVTLGDGDTFINCGNYWNTQPSDSDFSVDVDSAILLGIRAPHFPAWFIEGVVGPRGVNAHRVTRSTLSGDILLLPNALWTYSSETQELQKKAAAAAIDGGRRQSLELLPLGTLLSGTVEGAQGNLWSAEAALFVRWGLFKSGNRQGFLDFVTEASQVPVTEDLFRKHLKLSYIEAQQQLEDYAFLAVNEPLRIPVDVPAAPKEAFRDATSTEVARIIGDWGRLEGRATDPADLEYKQECLEQADRLFERIIARKEQDPLFLAAFGLYEIDARDYTRARKALEAATAAEVVRPRAYLELARLRLDMTLSGFQEGIGDLNQTDYSEILNLLSTTQMQMPALLGTYYVYARAFEHAPVKPQMVDMRVLEEGIRIFPQNANLAYKVATLYKRLGYPDDAKAVVERAMKHAESEHDRKLLNEFSQQGVR